MVASQVQTDDVSDNKTKKTKRPQLVSCPSRGVYLPCLSNLLDEISFRLRFLGLATVAESDIGSLST